jgi:hypothetical protein
MIVLATGNDYAKSTLFAKLDFTLEVQQGPEKTLFRGCSIELLYREAVEPQSPRLPQPWGNLNPLNSI